MGKLSEHTGNGTPTKQALLREETTEHIDGLLQQCDVLSSRFDRAIFKYISVYLLGLLFLSESLLILWFLNSSPQLQAQVGSVLLVSGLSVLAVVVVLIFLWLFNVWRLRMPKTLHDLLEQKHIALPNGDATTSYLSFLEHYRDALASPKRYLLSGFPMICFSSLIVYIAVYYFSIEHTPNFVVILGGVGVLLFALDIAGGLFVIGIVMWVMYISGWYVRKLVRTFEFSIQPFHPDQCGGLKGLGNFCFGLGAPLLLFTGFIIGKISLILGTRGLGTVFLAANVGFPPLCHSSHCLCFLAPLAGYPCQNGERRGHGRKQVCCSHRSIACGDPNTARCQSGRGGKGCARKESIGRSTLYSIPNMAFSCSLENLLDCPGSEWKPPARSGYSGVPAVHLNTSLPYTVALASIGGHQDAK